MAQKRTRALLIVEHGSRYTADSSEPVCLQAKEIQNRGIFDEVHTAFCKKEPALCRVVDTTRLCHSLDAAAADDVFVVPFFISAGYFTEQIVPREMKLKKGLNTRGNRRIVYCEPVGTHPAMTSVILNHAKNALEGSSVALSKISLFIVGHGTAENENSTAAVQAQVKAIRALNCFGQVEPAFMKEEPSHKTILARVDQNHLIIVPFFISDGLHSRQDIPSDIGFVKRGQTWENPVQFQGKTLWYTKAIGSDPRMADVILERVKEAEEKFGI